jgi:signal transduction histidine kinase/predicted hydrocarbon binding protein
VRGKPAGGPRRARPRGAGRAGRLLTTVRVPGPIEPAFVKAQEFVSRYFSRKVENPEHGTLSISGERYVLVRAASMSVEFFDLVTSLYQDKGPAQARSVASNLLFDVAHAIGKADARSFQQRMGLRDPIEKLSAGPIHFSFSGWAFVDIFPESHPSPDQDYYLIYDHPFSFESDAWLKHGRGSEFPVCVMNAGYSSGWCEESFGLPLVAAEVECQASGGRHCRFVMAPPSRIEEHLARYASGSGGRSGSRTVPRGRSVSIPEFFQRKRMEDELRTSHESLERRVAERTAELLSINDRLRLEIAERKRAEEARDEFLSVAAHELKTPLTSLRGFVQVLLRQVEKGSPADPARLAQALQTIDAQSQKLSRLVGQLLDVSRIDAGRLVVETKPVNLVTLVEDAVAAARTRTSRHVVSLRAPTALVAPVDPLRLEQVLTNLLENAIRFSPRGGAVKVTVRREGGLALIAIADQGVGVPPEHRGRIFDRFFQVPGAANVGGMGLGLHISRQIVELHGGRLTAEFPAQGGARLVVALRAEEGR